MPLGALTEVVGPECSGRSSFAHSLLAGMTRAAKVCAWIDVSNALDPESAVAAGVDLSRLLWARCGAQSTHCAHAKTQCTFSLPERYLVPPPAKKGLHGGSFGPHPRNEGKGLSVAISGLLQPKRFAPRCAEPQHRVRSEKEVVEPNSQQLVSKRNRRPVPPAKPWSRIEQALHVTDLLLQGGGFSAVVLDLGSIAPEYTSRVPLATWFRYRAAAERTQASILLLTQHPCAKSSAELLLRFQSGKARRDEATVFAGIEHRLEVVRRRFAQAPTNVVPLREPPQSVRTADWRSRTTWAGPR